MMNRIGNLPPQSTPFIGRTEELAQLNTLLANPDCRLLTLVGPGGVGKTRLALEAAASVVPPQAALFPDGVYFVALQPLNSYEYLIPTIAEALKLSFYGQDDIRTQLFNYLREKRLLLLLDNFEHLLDGVGLVSELLAAAPQVKIMTTSREVLNLQEEWLYPVKGMSFPLSVYADQIEDYEAVQFFLHSARRAQPDFSLVDERNEIINICRLAEGMPLALELAASWVRVLSGQQIAAEMQRNLDFLTTSMRNLPERHRSMRAVFNHSWNFLSEEERRVFEKLSVFRGGFDRDAAERVAGANLPVLAALVEKSLLYKLSSGRYDIHELLRQFAYEQLEASLSCQTVRDSHSQYFLDLMRQRGVDLKGGRQMEALREIETDFQNVCAAWEWTSKQGNAGWLDTALDGTALFYELRSRFQEGAQSFRRSTEVFKENETLVCRLLAYRGMFLADLGQYSQAYDVFQNSLSLARQHKLAQEEAYNLYGLARVTYYLSDPETAKQYCRESLVLYERQGNQWGKAHCLQVLGRISVRLSEDVESQTMLRESVDLYRLLGDQHGLAKSLVELGVLSLLKSNWLESRRYLEESLVIAQQIDSQGDIASALDELGRLLFWGMRAYDEARLYYEQGLAIRREIGDQSGIACSLCNLADLAYEIEDYAEARRLFSQGLEIELQTGDLLGIAIAQVGLGNVALETGQVEVGLSYYRDALKLMMDVQVTGRVMTSLMEIGSQLKKIGQHTAALAILVLVYHHPATLTEMRSRAAQVLETMRDISVDQLLDDRMQALTFIHNQRALLTETLSLEQNYLEAWSSALGTLPGAQRDLLSQRELEVLQLLSAGLSNREIADHLVIGIGTVKTHTLNIYGKLDVNNRTQAVARARELRLLSSP
jgi:predicted ATPase/DNA-binding NarL/FixJ family response regulator